MKDKELGLKLIKAIEGGRTEEITLYLENPNTDLNAKDDRGCTVLHWAFFKQDNDLLIRLVQQGSNVNEKNEGGFNVMHYACIRSDIALIKALIEHKADVNIQDNQKLPPLYYVCMKNNVEAVKILINSEGFDAKVLDISVQKVFTKIWIDGHKDIVQKLIEGGMEIGEAFLFFLWKNGGKK